MIKNKNRAIARLAGLLAWAACSGFAEQAVLEVSDDSWVNGNIVGDNYGALTDTRLRYQNTSWGNNHALFKFDLSALPAAITVDSVRMRFYIGLASWPGPTNFAPVAIYRNTEDWDESTVVFSNAPAYSTSAAVETLDHFGLTTDPIYFAGTNTITSGGWLEFEGEGTVALMQGWANGSIPNHGISMWCEGDFLSDQRTFRPQTKEHGSSAVWPELIVNYTVDYGYATWAEGWGIDIGGKTNDFDGDGLSNLYEFGLGGDPTNGLDRGTFPTFGIVNAGGGSNVFSYVHPQLADPNSGLDYRLLLNTNLVDGTWSQAGYSVSGTNVTGGTLDAVTNTTDMAANEKFIRLMIVALEDVVPEFQHFLEKAGSGEPVVVAYLGGSITRGAITYPASGENAANEAYDYSTYNSELESWRALSYEWLRARFEQTPGQFQQIDAAIGGTPSLLGAYRLEQDILSRNPDLVFVEYAVNDVNAGPLTRDDPNAPRSILRTTRSIVERLREQNPNVAIFMPLSTHRVLEGSASSSWAEYLDLSHDQMQWSAESLGVPYISLLEAFYSNPEKQTTEEPYYDGPDTPGNYVHPSPHGHRAYAEVVEQALTEIFDRGIFSFKLSERERTHVLPSPVTPRLILPETLVSHSNGWIVEMLEEPEAPVLEGHACLLSPAVGELEYTFNGTEVALWFDIQSVGYLEIILDGEMMGLYANRVASTGTFSGRFFSIADALDPSVSHTLRLVPVRQEETPCQVLLRAVAVDIGL